MEAATKADKDSHVVGLAACKMRVFSYHCGVLSNTAATRLNTPLNLNLVHVTRRKWRPCPWKLLSCLLATDGKCPP